MMTLVKWMASRDGVCREPGFRLNYDSIHVYSEYLVGHVNRVLTVSAVLSAGYIDSAHVAVENCPCGADFSPIFGMAFAFVCFCLDVVVCNL